MNRLSFDDISYQVRSLLFCNSEPRKVLFEHVPKCGGTTVNNYLKSHYSKDKVFVINGARPFDSIKYFISLPKEERYSYDLVCGHGAYKLKDYVHPRAIRFTILRDPVDRIISHYYYVLRSPKHYLYDEIVKKKMSLMDYITSNVSNELRNNFVCRFLGKSPKNVEKDADKAVIDAYNVLKNDYAAVGIIEDFNQTMDLFAKKAFFNKKIEVKELNKTINRPQKKEINEITLKAIKEMNSLDIKLYDLVKKDYLAQVKN